MPNPREGDKWGEDEAFLKESICLKGSLAGASTWGRFQHQSPMAFPTLRAILAGVKSRVPVFLDSQGYRWNNPKFLIWPGFLGDPGCCLPLPLSASHSGRLLLFEDAKFIPASRLRTCCSWEALSPDVGCWLLLIQVSALMTSLQ